MPELLRGWFVHLLRQSTASSTTWHVGSMHHVLRIAYFIGHSKIEEVLDTVLFRRVRKLGDYYGAALALITNAEQIPWDRLQRLRVVEAVPPTHSMRLVHTNPVDTVNAWARHIREPEVSEQELRLAFPEMDEIPKSPTATYTTSVHCECTLLLNMINATVTSTPTPTPMLLEIGVSKSSCFMCREFLAAVPPPHRTGDLVSRQTRCRVDVA